MQRCSSGIKLEIMRRTNVRPRSRVYHPQFPSNYVGSGSNVGKQRTEKVGAGAIVRLLAVHGVSLRLCCRASCRLVAVHGGPDVMFSRGCADQ